MHILEPGGYLMSRVRIAVAAMIAAAVTLCGCAVNVNVNTEPSQDTGTGKLNDIVILFTNDVHCDVDDDMGYAGLAAYKKDMAAAGYDVLLVDDGDEIQGGALGSLTKGDAIIDIMNGVGYDIVIPGNHEFDYGCDNYFALTKKMSFPVICSNLYDLRTGKTVFPPYIIKELGGRKIAFVGATTPTTLTESNPRNFSDENGELIYDFCQGNDGKRFYENVQNSVDAARAEGADITILIAHLGINDEDSPYMSTELITNTTGIDVVLDGHSHSEVEMEKVRNKDGHDVILSQTGCKFDHVGKLTIDKSGNMKTEFIDYDEERDKKDQKVSELIEKEEEGFEKILDEKIGHTDYDMMATVDGTSTWLVRNIETNMGDFTADAYKFATGAEAAIVNGGGVRADIMTGDITYQDLLNVNPYSNELCIRLIKGSELADALELSVAFEPEPFGGFLQVSGITFDVDLDVPSCVKLDDEEAFAGFSGEERRVSNIRINGEPLDPDREYKIGSINFLLFDEGNGYNMFTGDKVELDSYFEDVDALVKYMKSLNGVVPEEYADIDGQERIHFVNE